MVKLHKSGIIKCRIRGKPCFRKVQSSIYRAFVWLTCDHGFLGIEVVNIFSLYLDGSPKLSAKILDNSF